MSARLRQLAALLGACGVVALAGCGDDEPEGEGLPPESVAAIDQRLDEIERRFSDAVDNDNPGACDDIEDDSFAAIADTIDSLPDDVDPDVRDALETSLERLQELTQEGCADVQPVETETTTTEAPAETTPETETTPPETTPPETTPPESTPQNGDGDGDGGATPPDQGGGGSPAPDPEGDG